MARKNVKFSINPLLSGPTLGERGRMGSPYRELAVDDIDVDPDQPRKVFGESALDELAQSMRELGVLTPILVSVTAGGSYRLIAGERRLRAAKKAGLKVIPAIVEPEESDDRARLAKQVVENVQRENLTSMERALAVGQLKNSYNWSIREIAGKTGMSKGSVQRSLEILELADDLQAALINGASESKVLLLAKVENREVRKELLARIEDYTRGQLEQAIEQLERGFELGAPQSYHGGTERRTKKAKKLSLEDKRIVEEIQQALSTRVVLARKAGNKGQGRLAIEFYSQEDLEEIYRKLTA